MLLLGQDFQNDCPAPLQAVLIHIVEASEPKSWGRPCDLVVCQPIVFPACRCVIVKGRSAVSGHRTFHPITIRNFSTVPTSAQSSTSHHNVPFLSAFCFSAPSLFSLISAIDQLDFLAIFRLCRSLSVVPPESVDSFSLSNRALVLPKTQLEIDL